MGLLVTTMKSWVRHGLVRSGAYRLLRRPRSNGRFAHLAPPDVQSRFETIYRLREWGTAHIPSSGVGSSLEATELLRRLLPSLLDEVGAEVLLDLGCGDFTWMQHVDLRQRYIGVDVVREIIAENQRRFGGRERQFLVRNGIVDPLPDADVVLCREVLFHLSIQDACALLKNVLSKPRRHFIATTDGETLFNSDIPSGDWRPLNLHSAPFKFPRPLLTIPDTAVNARRSLGVWEADSLREALGLT